MTKTPYEVLGISPESTEEEIRKAYISLVKKYHPDKYQGNPLADLAEEKLAEVNEAYEQIKAEGSGGSYKNNTTDTDYSNEYLKVRAAISNGEMELARELLINMKDRDAEWFYLSGVVSFQQGLISDAIEDIKQATDMDPFNSEYATALHKVIGIGGLYRNRSDSYGYDSANHNSALDALTCATLPLCFCC